MGILDGIVDWLATQVMNLLDLASTSVLGALGCNMDTFKRYFPAASAMYEIFIWTAIGLVLLNLVWQLYRCYGAGFDIDTENPINLVVRSVIFLLLIWYCDDIVNLALQIGGTPYNWNTCLMNIPNCCRKQIFLQRKLVIKSRRSDVLLHMDMHITMTSKTIEAANI